MWDRALFFCVNRKQQRTSIYKERHRQLLRVLPPTPAARNLNYLNYSYAINKQRGWDSYFEMNMHYLNYSSLLVGIVWISARRARRYKNDNDYSSCSPNGSRNLINLIFKDNLASKAIKVLRNQLPPFRFFVITLTLWLIIASRSATRSHWLLTSSTLRRLVPPLSPLTHEVRGAPY
jgi:hypothetical protein